MQLKHIAAALSLALGLSHGGHTLAAGDPPARAIAKKLAQGSSEDLLARTVFQVLLGELALRRGDPKLSSDAWADLAQRTRDPKVIARATEIAGGTRQYERALELTKLWLEVEPDSTKAKQTQSSLLILSNRLDELAPQLTALLEQDKPNLANNLMQLNRMLAKHGDKIAVQKLVGTGSLRLTRTSPRLISPWPRPPPMPATTSAPSTKPKNHCACDQIGKSLPWPEPSCRPSNRQP